MTATVIPFPARLRLVPRVARKGDRVMILDECALADMIGETPDGRRARVLHRGFVRIIDFARLCPLAPGPGAPPCGGRS